MDKQKKTLTVYDLAYIALMTALICVCSWITIPATVPFTMQTFAVFVSVLLLGGMRGSLSVLIYILLGAVGAPVFSGFKGGLAALLGPTGGYIIGFFFSAICMWGFEKAASRSAHKRLLCILSMLCALLLCYAFGTVWFERVYLTEDGTHIGIAATLGLCVFPFVIPDLLKLSLAFALSRNKTLRRVLRHTGA
ncbi:MAG: biotin transporter BioY [Lachnospiraceae bacterium]|nr:biotin transporter BioY [Lachnospiraceae bacterium]